MHSSSAFLVTLTNPKAIVLFASVFATAVTGTTPVWLMVGDDCSRLLQCLIWYALVSFFMSSAPVIRRFQNARHWIERAAGVCFIAIGGRILADGPQPGVTVIAMRICLFRASRPENRN